MTEQNAFNKAVTDNNIKEVTKLLKDPEVNPAYFNNEAIRWAADFGYIELFKLLLSDKRVNPADFDNFALEQSCYHGHLEILLLLLEDERIIPNRYNNKALHCAALGKQYETIKLLINHNKFDYFFSNNNLEHIEEIIIDAIKENDINFIKILLKYKPFNFSFKNNTIIISANSNNKTDIVNLLWENKDIRNTLQNNDLNLYNKLKKIETKYKINSFQL